jgi:bifunctional oligoribonuclease and PAP phosphatase NrnA
MKGIMKARAPENWSRILDLLRTEDRFLVMSHTNPDGDALGSTAAVGWLLQALGKTYWLYNASPLPERFSWLRFPHPLSQKSPDWEPHWHILLDCGDARRVGPDMAQRLPQDRIVNIDHHISNAGFGALNLVEPRRSSVGEIIGYLAKDLGIVPSGPLGEAIYLAMVTDTGSFTYENTGPGALELAAEIVRQGLNLGEFNTRLQNQWRISRIRLMGEVLRTAKLFSNGQIGLVAISKAIRDKHQASIEDCDDLVDLIRRVKGVRIAASLREDEDRKIKFSLRSSGETDVESIASSVGGGGHKNASGGEFHTTLDVAESKLIRMIQRSLVLADKNPSSETV